MVCSPLSNINSIEMINTRNKLKAHDGPGPYDIQDRYKETKLGSEYCKYMINESE